MSFGKFFQHGVEPVRLSSTAASLRIGNGAPGSGIVAGAIHCFPLAPWIPWMGQLSQLSASGQQGMFEVKDARGWG